MSEPKIVTIEEAELKLLKAMRAEANHIYTVDHIHQQRQAEKLAEVLGIDEGTRVTTPAGILLSICTEKVRELVTKV